MTVRFDGYTATALGVKPEDLVGILFRVGDEMHEGRGFHTFGHRLGVRDGSGSEVGAIQWGGKQGDRIMFEVKGERSPAAVERFRSLVPEHRCTRVDPCADFDSPGVFDRLLPEVLDVKKSHRLYGECRGDWADFPDKGRTQYLGSSSSPIKARMYEKGKQPEYAHLNKPDWVRLELQVRPQKDAKDSFSTLSPLQVWGASKWSRDLAARILAEHVDPHPAGTVYKLSDRDSKLRWMLRQYGPTLTSLAYDCGGWDAAGLTLREMLKEMREG